MTKPAPNYQTIEATSTEGLQDLFAVQEVQTSAHDSQPQSHESQCESVETHLILTAAEASAYLRIPVSTIYRRIKAGKFKTLEGQDGAVRIVLANKIVHENHSVPTNAESENHIVDLILSDSQWENRENQPGEGLAVIN